MLDLFLKTFFKGVFLGLSISIPLGPIGMLIIQRTLNRGVKHGFITGLGATTSDIVYSIVTMYFLSFVIGFIEQHKLIIQIVGFIVVVIFGVFTYRSNPVAHPRPHEQKVEYSLLSDFFSSFMLTLSNPLILFVLIAIFTQTTFISSESNAYLHITGLLGILCGASLWWLFLTYFTSRFRHKLNVRGLKLINRITGVIIILIGIIGLILGFGE